jgi:hypothetical protein
MHRLAAALVCLVVSGCGTAPAGEARVVEAGTEVTLAPGATVVVKAADTKVRFIAVTEDSRCPSDVTCIWAGVVKVQLEIRHAAQAVASVEILVGGSAPADAYRVSLVRVEPQPISTARIAPQDYRATLKIEKME